jgi:hypothetical protein
MPLVPIILLALLAPIPVMILVASLLGHGPKPVHDDEFIMPPAAISEFNELEEEVEDETQP